MELHVEAGTLLVAGPDMLDPHFMHSVVMICQHGEEGAYGLSLNRPSRRLTRDVLSEEMLLGTLPVPLWVGGPVGHDTLQLLHRVPERITGGIEIVPGVWIGGDLDSVAEFAREDFARFEREVRLFLGYAGWGAQQLESELTIGSWLPAVASPEFLFHSDPEQTWREVLRSIGPSASGLDEQPPDPQWN